MVSLATLSLGAVTKCERPVPRNTGPGTDLTSPNYKVEINAIHTSGGPFRISLSSEEVKVTTTGWRPFTSAEGGPQYAQIYQREPVAQSNFSTSIQYNAGIRLHIVLTVFGEGKFTIGINDQGVGKYNTNHVVQGFDFGMNQGSGQIELLTVG